MRLTGQSALITGAAPAAASAAEAGAIAGGAIAMDRAEAAADLTGMAILLASAPADRIVAETTSTAADG